MLSNFMRCFHYIISMKNMKSKHTTITIIILALLVSKVIDFNHLSPVDFTIIILWFIDTILTFKESSE